MGILLMSSGASGDTELQTGVGVAWAIPKAESACLSPVQWETKEARCQCLTFSLAQHHMSLVLWLDLSCPLPRRFRRRNSVRQSDVSVGTWGEKPLAAPNCIANVGDCLGKAAAP